MLLALFSGEMTASGETTWGYKSLVIFQGTPVQLSAPILGGGGPHNYWLFAPYWPRQATAVTHAHATPSHSHE